MFGQTQVIIVFKNGTCKNISKISGDNDDGSGVYVFWRCTR